MGTLSGNIVEHGFERPIRLAAAMPVLATKYACFLSAFGVADWGRQRWQGVHLDNWPKPERPPSGR